MSYRLEIWIQGVPAAMNAVMRMHWTKRNRYFDQWYAQIQSKVWSLKPRQPLDRVSLTFERHAYRTLDFDGCVASMKPLADGLVHAGILKNDTYRITGPWTVTQAYRPKGQECVRVLVEESGKDLEF